MTKGSGLSLILICICVLTFEINATSYVNNVTVPSDILTNLLFDEIKNYPHSLEVPVESTGIYNTIQCVMALQQIAYQFPSLKVLPFIDSWGKFPSGLLYGHLRDLGNFDQCVRISTNLSETLPIVNGQYCFASIPVVQSQTWEIPNFIGFDVQTNDRAIKDLIRIGIAACIPDVCSPTIVEVILQKAADRIFNGTLSGIKLNNCVTAEKPPFKAINIVGIVIFSITGALMVLSTAYDAYTVLHKKTARPLMLSFSVLTNGRKLFAISTKKSSNSIECLTGIRVLSMFWVLLCHNYVFSILLPYINYIDIISWYKAASSMHIVNGTLSVDTFFFISGLLVAWLGFRELDKSKGKLNILLMYFHRYIRLTPAVAAVILFLLSISEYIGSGPIKQEYINMHSSCKTNWWSTLLYVQNYVNAGNICVAQTWYLAVDTQLYILSPLILLPLWKWGRKFTPVMIMLSLMSIGCIVATYFVEGYTKYLPGGDYGRRIYLPTHTRYSVWLVGIGLGYFMHKNDHRNIRPSKLLQYLGWLVCFTTILSIIYGPYFTMHSEREKTVLEVAMNESLKRIAWGIAMSWIVFACHFGFGGIINSFLSHPWWQPMGRLTFSLYLVHLAVLTTNFGMTRTEAYFSDYQQLLSFWGTFGISLMAAIVLTLAFESPVLVIEKSLLGSSKSDAPKQQITSSNMAGNVSSEVVHKSV